MANPATRVLPQRSRGRRVLHVGALLVIACLPPSVAAASLQVRVDDGKKVALADAVVSARRLDAPAPVVAGKGIMDQRFSQFVPGVLPITVGSVVVFPNSDNIRHQVYSFSPAKPFELPLYAGTPAAPQRFDKPGVVVVGCNIHDWMIGYIVVLDTPYFAKTDAAGQARLELPPGRYAVRSWHARQAGDAPETVVDVVAATPAALALHLKLMPPAPPRRGVRRIHPVPAG